MAEVNNKEKSKKKLWLIAALLCLLVALVALGVFAKDKFTQLKAETNLSLLAESTNIVSGSQTSAPPDETASAQATVPAELTLADKIALLEEKHGIDIPDKNLDFNSLRKNTNKDIYAWIYIPGTKVDYPIVQHPTDNKYYLDYNLDGTKGYPGCIYTENYNKKDFTDRHTVIYGHNMKNGSMFATLHRYEDREFFDKNRYIYVFTENDVFVYKIFAAHEFPSIHLLLGFDLSQDKIFLDYLQGIMDSRKMNCNLDKTAEFTANSKILTLSTA